MLIASAPNDTSDPDAIRIFRHASGDLAHDVTKVKNTAVRVNRRLLEQLTSDEQMRQDTGELVALMANTLAFVDAAETEITAAHAGWHDGDGNSAAIAMNTASRYITRAFDDLEKIENRLRCLVAERDLTPAG
jgi:hypothetical protein